MASTVTASVVVVGSCMTDLVSYTSRLPKQGETIHGNSFSIAFGGKGANQCVAAAKLGAAATMISKVGNDSFGYNYIKNFDENNINREHVHVVSNVSTGVATIIVDELGQNSIVIIAGANLHLNIQDVLDAENTIKMAKVLVCQREISDIATKQALLLGNKYKITTLMNAAPASVNMDVDIFSLSDIFCVNETEAEIITGIPVTSLFDAEVAAKAIVKKGSRTVIITLGAKGAVLATGDSFKHIPCPQASSVVDTTGAGDAFIGALAYFLSSTMPALSLTEMIEKSCKIATFSVQLKGTQTSYPTWDELKDMNF